MKIKKLSVIAGLSLCSMSSFAQATQNTYWSERFRYDRESATLFNPNELSLDLFGTYADRNRFAAPADNFGGGLGLNYFLTRYIGVSADSYIEEWKLPYRVNGSLILRLPIDQIAMAPYVFGGGGREFKYLTQWTYHVGGGVEFRMNSHTGIFADGRRVFSDRSGVKDTALVRFGLRLGF